MRKTLFTLVIFALASPALAQTVECDGMESTGSGAVDSSCDPGPRMYAYPVTDPNGNMTDVYIGTDDCNAGNYSAVCMPANWSFTVERLTQDHYPEKTPHEDHSPGPEGHCRCQIHWNGPAGLPWNEEAEANFFRFGFNSKQPSHDVGWQTVDGVGSVDENWAGAVGAGTGPVHGPAMGPIPAVSHWGIFVMLLLVAAAGTVVIRRRAAVV